MVVAVVTSQLLPVVITIATVATVIFTLLLCVCGKSKKDEDPELTNVKQKHSSAVLPPDTVVQVGEDLNQGDVSDTTAVHLEVETAVTPLVTQNTQNGNLHKRGESLDLSKNERNSQTSSGSSPRPNAISRELPEIPIISKNQTPAVESSLRGGHGHLPDIPTGARQSATLPANHRTSAVSPSASRSIVVGAERQGANSELRESGSKVKSCDENDDCDDYDHLDEQKRKNLKRRSDYDHVVIDQGRERIIPAKSSLEENDYAEVKAENIYEGVPDDVTVVKVSKSSVREVTVKGHDPYATMKDDDPYNEIKGDDPYNKIKNDFDPYNRIKDDPYNRVKDDDPYNKVKGDDAYEDVADETFPRKKKDVFNRAVDDPYALVMDDERDVSNQSSQVTDPYARVNDDISDINDPYNRVKDDIEEEGAIAAIGDDDYATVNKVQENVEYAQVNKNRHIRNSSHGNSGLGDDGLSNSALGNPSTSSTSVEIVHDEYATVVKVRKAVTALANPEPSSAINSTTPIAPPEPPRRYEREEQRTSARLLNTESQGDQLAGDQPVVMESQNAPPADGMATEVGGARKKEPPYTKLTARESLASMNARIASNTYEMVRETDNLYATVEGGSDDGVVRPRSAHRPVSTRESVTSEYYAEIGEGATAAAPAPPSLDSLHETAKIHQEEIRRKGDPRPGDLGYYSNMDGDSNLGHHHTPSGHFRTPSGDAVNGPVKKMAAMATNDPDPDYQSVQDEDAQPDGTSEFDPNYETVEEAKSKVKYELIKDDAAVVAEKKIRLHVYEEVTVPNEGRRTRQRVLNQHMYEDITEVKGQNSAKGQSSNSEVQKRNRSGHQRKSSSDSNKVSKRKSGEVKEKNKDKRKSADGKDNHRKSGELSKK